MPETSSFRRSTAAKRTSVSILLDVLNGASRAAMRREEALGFSKLAANLAGCPLASLREARWRQLV
jgi:hypothetical protein